MSKLTLKNAPKSTGRIQDDSELLAMDEDLSVSAKEIAQSIKNPEQSAPKVDIVQTAKAASDKLGEFRLSALARSLLDRAMINVGENTGRGIEDPIAKDAVETLAGIVKASGDNLTSSIEVIAEAMPEDASTYVYKLCYAVQKALNFIGNMQYRRALDPKSDFDLHAFISGGQSVQDDEKGAKFAVDQREEHQTAPVGLGDDTAEIAFDADGNRLFNIAGGESALTDYEQIIEALTDLHVYLQLLTETFGWNPEIAMPYMALYDQTSDRFDQITDCETCLDLMEVRYKESRAKKQEKQLAGLKKIRDVALAALKKASK